MTKVRVTAEARDDIRSIRIYSKRIWGVAVAKDCMAGLRRTFGMLGENPFAGALEEQLSGDIRAFTYRSHRLFYRVIDREVEIVRILHYARDVPKAFAR